MSELHVGGQAVIEGVMMRSPRCFAVAVRTPSGAILVRQRPWISLAQSWKILRRPFFRGVLVLAESLHNGISALNFSAAVAEAGSKEKQDAAENHAEAQVDQQGQRDQAQRRRVEPPSASAAAGPKVAERSASIWITMGVAIVLALGLFAALPHFLTWGAGKLVESEALTGGRSVLFHLVDGAIKLAIFLAYVWLISLLPDVKRVFQYHGAEHKAIYTAERGEPLTVENARRHTTLHPRCGTSFLLVVLLAAVVIFTIVFPFVPAVSEVAVVNQLFFVLVKLLLLFPIAGMAYELIRLAGRRPDSRLLRLAIWPGLMTQKITTREPDDSQLEVALTSILAVLAKEKSLPPGADPSPGGDNLEEFGSFEAYLESTKGQ